MRKPRTVYLDNDSYQRLKELCHVHFHKPVSREIDELIKKRLAELEGREISRVEGVDYEKLKRAHSRLVREVDVLEKRLVKRKVYDQLVECATTVGVDTADLSSLPRFTSEMLRKWEGLREDMHQFITLLETVREKREVERKLAEVRKAERGS